MFKIKLWITNPTCKIEKNWFDLSVSSFYFIIILSSFLSSEPFKIFSSLYVFSSSNVFLDSSFKSWGLLSREASCLSLLN